MPRKAGQLSTSLYAANLRDLVHQITLLASVFQVSSHMPYSMNEWGGSPNLDTSWLGHPVMTLGSSS